jgi:hypothetical protein
MANYPKRRKEVHNPTIPMDRARKNLLWKNLRVF